MNLKILHEPYPFNNNWKREVISALFFGLFVFFFLQFFQPFGLSNYHSDNKTWELAGYGLVTTSVLLLNNTLFSLLLPKWFSRNCWTVGKNILYTTYMFLCIGMGNFLYSVWRKYLIIDFDGFLFYQGMTLMVGVFPVTISTFLIYSNRLKKAAEDASELNSVLHNKETKNHNQIEIPSQNKSENIKIDLGDLLSIRSVENYIEINTLENGELKKQIVRNTLKKLEEHLSDYAFIKKCHRSHLVNLQQVDNFSGNAQGLSLHFQQPKNFEVPVSRAFVKNIKTEISK